MNVRVDVGEVFLGISLLDTNSVRDEFISTHTSLKQLISIYFFSLINKQINIKDASIASCKYLRPKVMKHLRSGEGKSLFLQPYLSYVIKGFPFRGFKNMRLYVIKGYSFRGFNSMELEFDICVKLSCETNIFSFQLKV